MRLTSIDGSFVDLRPLRYQFPDISGDGTGQDWDANWLVIQGEVTDGGRRWKFADPCLTTAEARELLTWLRGVASGRLDAGDKGSNPIWFTEPNLEVALRRRAEGTAVLVWSFAAEASPPVDREQPVEIEAPLAAIVVAADEWERELADFPRR